MMNEQYYLALLKKVLDKGELQKNRTGVDTLCLFGEQLKFDLSEGDFPLLTTKKMAWNAIVHELLWFIAGQTNAGALIEKGVKIWNEWTPAYKKEGAIGVQKAFAENPRHPDLDLGPVYGRQWRNFGQERTLHNGRHALSRHGIDQLVNVLRRLETNPECRRLIVSAWNPVDVPEMALPPCHCFFQFRVLNAKLHMQMYQRSADMFLGVPFNIASYALLLLMVAHVTGFKPGTFTHTFGDAHIYVNHIDQVREQLDRNLFPAPKVFLNPDIKSLFEFQFRDIQLDNYQSGGAIKAAVAV